MTVTTKQTQANTYYNNMLACYRGQIKGPAQGGEIGKYAFSLHLSILTLFMNMFDTFICVNVYLYVYYMQFISFCHIIVCVVVFVEHQLLGNLCRSTHPLKNMFLSHKPPPIPPPNLVELPSDINFRLGALAIVLINDT